MMRHLRWSTLSSGIFISLVFFLSGCRTPLPVTHFYVLSPAAVEPALTSGAQQNGPSVAVAALRLPRYLERPQIVIRSSENRLEMVENHQWAGNLRKNMMRVLAVNLSKQLGTADVTISPVITPAPPDYRVEVEILAFEKDPGGQIRLSAQWRLYDEKKPGKATARMVELVSPEYSPATDVEGAVAIMSELFGKLSRMIGLAIMEGG